VSTQIPWAALGPVLLVAVGFVIWVVVDIVRSSSVRVLPKWAWIVLSVISVPLGGIVYLLFGRQRDY
jgi:uncharacterized membrane protein